MTNPFPSPINPHTLDLQLIKPEWIRKSPKWKILLAKIFGRKIISYDGELYAIAYLYRGKYYHVGGGLVKWSQ